MSDRTQASIVVDAPAERVMAAIADFDNYPKWVATAKEVTVLERSADGRPARVRFVIDAGFLKDTYELVYTWEAGGRAVSWELAESTMQRSQHGSYELRSSVDGASTTVTYTLEVTVHIPMLGMLRRKAEKTITDTALKELKRHVEGSE
ncbi:SRPBCC family protein [Tsukamurella sp. 8F]|uniref:SRPBCC family protein n=1 Tax=unclassified Tsukamurella TaxID=2633480 RepID=UPI0023B88EAB|nr:MULTISPECIES: SRPBCC family protein [unclassified Tsukamurella]MDF0532013.1 SRPBCC family protein [Tsukamurella sp. 8J]MDF0588418.1 SRPBCC family protein [Tsukamurella sp. 8F]